MKRFMRWLAKKMLPQPIRQGLKRRLGGKRPSIQGCPLNITATPTQTSVFLDEKTAIYLRPGRRELLEGIFADANHSGELAFFLQNPANFRRLLDVGANTGAFSALFCRQHPENRAVAVEPSPFFSEDLHCAKSLNDFGDRFQIEPIGLGAKSGPVTMLLDTRGGYVQLAHYQHSMWGDPMEIEVPVRTIDDLCEASTFSPDLIKIDVEGYELEVLSGGVNTLGRSRPELLLEIHLDYLDERRINPKQLITLLEEFRYQYSDLSGRKLSPNAITDYPANRIHVRAMAKT